MIILSCLGTVIPTATLCQCRRVTVYKRLIIFHHAPYVCYVRGSCCLCVCLISDIYLDYARCFQMAFNAVTEAKQQ